MPKNKLLAIPVFKQGGEVVYFLKDVRNRGMLFFKGNVVKITAIDAAHFSDKLHSIPLCKTQSGIEHENGLCFIHNFQYRTTSSEKVVKTPAFMHIGCISIPNHELEKFLDSYRTTVSLYDRVRNSLKMEPEGIEPPLEDSLTEIFSEDESEEEEEGESPKVAVSESGGKPTKLIGLEIFKKYFSIGTKISRGTKKD